MASEKLRKYLAYYQKVLRDDPENIEARLRLAAIFREMGRKNHAVEEYSTASKLLARGGLPLEAIAACKAVLELDPTHTESQFFLAKLYAQMPSSTARIAQPVAGPAQPQSAASVPRSMQDFESDELDNAVSMIELVQPKGGQLPSSSTRNVDVIETVWNAHEAETRKASLASLEVTQEDLESPREGLEEATESLEAVPRWADAREAELTVELRPVARTPDLYATVDLQADDIIEDSDLPRERQSTSRVPPVLSQKLAASSAEQTETINLSVFDMDSLELDDEEFDIPDLEEIDYTATRPQPPRAHQAVVNATRSGLPVIPLFSQVSQDAFMRIVQAIEIRRYRAGQTIVSPNSARRSLFVIVRGTTLVWRDVEGSRIPLAEMGEGEFFGEFRLLTGRDGMATVSAKTDVELLELNESHIAAIGESSPEIWDVLWDFYYKRMLNNLLASHALFRPLSPQERHTVAAHFSQREVLQGEYMLRAGDVCKHLYLVMTGEISAERNLDGLVQTLAELREGEFFGVASALGDDPYPADIRAVRDTIVFALPSPIFRKVVDAHVEVAREVQREMRKRRQLNHQFSSGITNYAELGIARETE